MMRRVLLGFASALAAAVGFSLLASVFICLGFDPETRSVSDAACPIFGILIGAYFASRGGSWKAGLMVGLVYVALWIGLWFYVMGRWTPALWLEEALPGLSVAHVAWWGCAILAGVLGGRASRMSLAALASVVVLLGMVLCGLMTFRMYRLGSTTSAAEISGYNFQRMPPSADGTISYLLTFDSGKANDFGVGLYDCDSDDANPYDDSNTSYMGQSLGGLIDKLAHRGEPNHRQVLCAINGGFFGASAFSVAHHEEPLVEMGSAHYNVDLLQPRDQSCFFAVNSSAGVEEGKPRYSLLREISWSHSGDYQTVLGGVRPLRIDSQSMNLDPGAGATSLRCSRTSIGWSADGKILYILIVIDPDGEMASQVQRRWKLTQTGGWDVRQVQQFWEEKEVPYAVLCDGGESTQLAYLKPGNRYHYVSSGYQYSFTIGYLFQRPLRFTLPILPPSEAHRGVLNYLYVDVSNSGAK